jgi:hypothetical protein
LLQAIYTRLASSVKATRPAMHIRARGTYELRMDATCALSMVSTPRAVGLGVGGKLFGSYSLAPFPPELKSTRKPLWSTYSLRRDGDLHKAALPASNSLGIQVNNRPQRSIHAHCTLAPGARTSITCPHHERPQAYMKSVHVRPSLAPPHVVSVRGTVGREAHLALS